jgi:holin-like protein
LKVKTKKSLKKICLAIPGLGIFFALLFIGDFTVNKFELAIPGVIFGMLFCLGFLGFYQQTFNAIPRFIERTSELFLPILPLFILPSCLGILNHLELLKEDAMKIVIALFIGIVLTQIVTPFIFIFSLKLFKPRS